MTWFLFHCFLVILPTVVAGTSSPSTFFFAVFAQIVEPPCCCSFGSVFDSNAFGVSYWCFLDPLFKLYWFHVAGVALPCHRVHHGWRSARSSP